MPEKALRLFPLPTKEIEKEEIHSDSLFRIIPPRVGRNPDLPYTVTNMVASVGGQASTGGKVAGIGSGVDRTTMRNIRAQVGSVMIGAGTLRAERLSLGLDNGPRCRQPLAVILTGGGDVPLGDNLVSHEGQDVLVITTREKASTLAESLKDRAEVLGIPEVPGGYLDLTHALRYLRQQRGIESVLVEGGPRLNQTLISCGLIDELFLTLAPKLLGGAHNDPRTILEGHLPKTVALRLMSVHLAADELFLRYSLSSPPD